MTMRTGVVVRSTATTTTFEIWKAGVRIWVRTIKRTSRSEVKANVTHEWAVTAKREILLNHI